MQRLDARKEDILSFIVRDFVGTAIPVSSGRISEKKVLRMSPATIRNIMLELDDNGYLYQPHTSAGRAPTEKGYRYFVNHLMEIHMPDDAVRDRIDEIMQDFVNEFDFACDELSRALAGHLKLFSGIGFLDEEEKFFGRGLSEVLNEPEFEERGLASRFADFTEHANINLRALEKDSSEENPRVDIGGFGIVSVFFDTDEFGRCALFSMGPRRMNYEKAASALKYAAKDITSGHKNKTKNGYRR